MPETPVVVKVIRPGMRWWERKQPGTGVDAATRSTG